MHALTHSVTRTHALNPHFREPIRWGGVCRGVLTGTLCLSYNDGAAAAASSPMGGINLMNKDRRSQSVGMGNRRSSLSNLLGGLSKLTKQASHLPQNTTIDDIRQSESSGMETL